MTAGCILAVKLGQMEIPLKRLMVGVVAAVLAAAQTGPQPVPIAVDYPVDQSIFPPEITPPTFLWRDPAEAATLWLIDISFAGGSPGLHVKSRGERMTVGEIDPRCVSPTNRPPTLTERQAAAHTWTPDAATWSEIKRRSVERDATLTITGIREADPGHALSRGRVTIRTSSDPVGAPIFYRDVPLMPSEVEKGVIKPLAPAAIPLIAWRLRDIGEPRSRVMMEGLHTCANCHSFSLDGKTLGMDMDGPQNDKGMYALVPISKEMSIRDQDVIEWSSFRGKLGSKIRVGFMSQVSPDGQYVVTMINATEAGPQPAVPATNGNLKLGKELEANYYVANFKEYSFLQVFFPTRGILAWYSRKTGRLQPLPGADDQRYVQTNAVWSPDGKYLVFARAAAKPPYPEDGTLAEFANDPKETQIRYDLYRIPFNGGQGGRARTDRRRLGQRHEQYLPQGFAGRPLDRVRPGAQRPADAPRQPPLHRPGAGRQGPADVVQHTAHELLAQFLAQRPVAGLLLQELVSLHPNVSDPPRSGWPRQPAHPDRQHHRRQPGSEHSRVREHPSRRPDENRYACHRFLSFLRQRV